MFSALVPFERGRLKTNAKQDTGIRPRDPRVLHVPNTTNSESLNTYIYSREEHKSTLALDDDNGDVEIIFYIFCDCWSLCFWRLFLLLVAMISIKYYSSWRDKK